jgi:hypothetical protein
MQIFEQVISDLAKHYFPTMGDVWRRQINYLRFHVRMSDFKEMTLPLFASRLLRINEYLSFFPACPRGIPANCSMKTNIMILGTGMDPDVMTWDAAVQYFQQLELRQALQNRANSDSNGTNNGKFNKRKRDNELTVNGNGGAKRNYGSNNGSGNQRVNGGSTPRSNASIATSTMAVNAGLWKKTKVFVPSALVTTTTTTTMSKKAKTSACT